MKVTFTRSQVRAPVVQTFLLTWRIDLSPHEQALLSLYGVGFSLKLQGTQMPLRFGTEQSLPSGNVEELHQLETRIRALALRVHRYLYDAAAYTGTEEIDVGDA